MSEYFVGTTGANSQTNFESLTTSQVLDDLSLNTGDSPTFSGLFVNSTGTGANNTLFSVDGSNGRLFGVTDDVIGSIFSVNDAAGLPIIEVESTSSYDKITMGEYGSDLLVLSGQSTVEITGSQIASESWVGQQGYITSATAANDATITLQGGTNITTSIGDFTTDQASAETLTINHATISRSDTTSSSTIAFGGTLSAINSITSSNGHVTAENTVSYTLPSLGTTSTTALAGNTTVNDVSETNLLNRLAALDSSDTIYIGDDGDDTTVVVRGTFQVDGSTTTINSNTLSIGDNQIVLNNDVTGTPTQNAGIIVERGTSTNASLIWDEANDYWKAGLAGSEVQLALTNGTYSGLRAQATTKTDVGLSNVTNESKATMFTSPSFTGDVVITDDTFPFIRSSTNAAGAGIKFSDQTGTYGQQGTLTFRHSDSQSYGSYASFEFATTEGICTILGGKLMYGEGIYSKPASGTGAGTRKDTNWDTAYGWGDHASAGYSIKASDETISGAKIFGNITSSAGYKASIAESSDADNITSNNIKYGYLANAASNKPVSGNSQYASVGNITLTHYDAAANDDFYIRASAYDGNTSWAKIFTDQNSAFAPLASPSLTGSPTAPTPSLSDNNTNIATTEYVKGQNYLTSETYSSASALLTAIKTVDGSGSGLDADTLDNINSSSFLRSDADDTVTGEITGSGDPSLSGFFLPQNPEGRHVKAPWFFNDMAYARLKGATISVTVTGGSSPSNTDIDAMFDASTGFWNMATSGVTEVVIEITNPPKTMYHGSHMGATFGNTTWRPKDIKLESYYNSQWNELLDVSNQSKEYVTTSYNSGSNAQSKLRWTFSNFNSTSMRIVSLFAYNYNATGMPSLYLANNGGELYGDVTLKSPTGASQSSYALKLRKTNSSSTAQDGAEIVSGPYSTNTNGGDLILKTSNTSAVLTERMRINGAGNVGIGTTSPASKLQVSTTNAANILTLHRDGSDNGANTTLNRIQFAQDFSSTQENWGRIDLDSNASPYRSDLKFYVKSTSGLEMLGMTVHGTASDGPRVGIGTTTPDSKLHVASGNVLISNNQFYTAESTLGTNYKLAGLTSGNIIQIGAIDYTSASTVFAGGDNLSLTTGGASGTTRLYINSSGEVGIGTSSPDHLLDLYKSTSTSGGSTGTTLQRLWNYVGSDLSQQKTFVDFVFQDDNANFTPQVRIGAEVGRNGDANAISKEGAGAFVVYTSNGTDETGSGELAERMRVDYQGNVGIGTTSPAAKLHAYNSAGGNASDKAGMLSEAVMKLQPHASNSTNMLFAQVNSGNGIGIQVTNSAATANWDIALSPFGGNVGIGTASPSYKLDVNGDFRVVNAATFSAATYFDQYLYHAGDTDTFIRFQTNDVNLTAAGQNMLRVDGNSTQKTVVVNEVGIDADFRVESSGEANALFVRGSDGNVGIGETAPEVKLEVAGDIMAKDSFVSAGATASQGYTFHDFGTGWGYKGVQSPSRLAMFTNSAERVTIDSNGNVGIGTTSPDYELHVIGTASFTDTVAGAYFEENASNPELKELDTGTILVMDEEGEIVPSCKANDTMVFGASKRGYKQPIVMGAEPIKMTGPIKVGDFITTSSRYGHGMRSETKEVGTIIAQAMESGDGDSYNIKAMIRKM